MRFVFFTLLSFVLLTQTSCTLFSRAPERLSGVSEATSNEFDVFGSSRISMAEWRKHFGKQLDDLLNQKETDEFGIRREALEKQIQKKYGFAFVSVSVVTYFKPNPGTQMTVDVVEPKDTRTRMPFKKERDYKKTFKDPGGAIGLFSEYQTKSFDLIRSGDFDYPKGKCPVFHCTMGFEDKRLAPYLAKINNVARKHESRILDILHEDKRADYRANAAFLLAHTKNGNKIAKEMLNSAFDPSSLVRNNAIRVLTELASDHPHIKIPIDPIVKMLEFPTTTDRNKAGWVMAALSQNKKNRKKIIQGSGRTLYAMLQLRQRNNREPAYMILKSVSGEKYPDTDLASWKKWLESNGVVMKENMIPRDYQP